ncbi:MAG: DnaJ domain-containing protein [Sphingomicrobium sp.]
MRPDHYATLEVEPSASAAEIRAAYVKLLREHHPDRNRSPEAVDRTKTIIAAFKVLGDFDQRSHYDWDRRRDREAAEAAAAAEPPRRRKAAGFAAGGIGLAAAGAWLLMPGAKPEPVANAPKTAAVEPERKSAAPVRTASARPAAERRERGATLIRMRPTLPMPVETRIAEPVAKSDPPTSAPAKAAAKPVERVALKTVSPRAVKAIAPRRADAVVAATRVAAKPAPPVRVAAKPATVVRVAAKSSPPAPTPRQSMARPATDLASLDQFVMNFYGQSWRYGDAPKRNALEQTRAGFVVRRGACVAEACKRAAYLKLMRDVSEIVETGKPQKP